MSAFKGSILQNYHYIVKDIMSNWGDREKRKELEKRKEVLAKEIHTVLDSLGKNRSADFPWFVYRYKHKSGKYILRVRLMR